MKKTLNLAELEVTTFEVTDKVVHEGIWFCTGCISGCGVLTDRVDS